jgi:biopolymer transport protein ExbD
MLFSKFRRVREEVDVNLIPVMNLFVTLIPFLLLAAAFYHVGVIPTSLPSQTDETSDIEVDTRAVTVNLLIEPYAIRLSASNAAMDEDALAALSLIIEKTDKGFDLDLLAKALFEIKRRYDRSDTIVVLPSDRVEYQDLVKILDAAREFSAEKDGKKGTKVPLFPVVVLSRKV